MLAHVVAARNRRRWLRLTVVDLRLDVMLLPAKVRVDHLRRRRRSAVVVGVLRTRLLLLLRAMLAAALELVVFRYWRELRVPLTAVDHLLVVLESRR